MLLLFVFLQIFKIDWWIDLQKCDVGVRANIVCLSSFSELAALLEKDKLALHLLTERTYIGGGGEHQQTLLCGVTQLVRL